MYTEKDRNKMKTFIDRLISNPCLKNESPLSIESNILQFLSQNDAPLKATFSSQEYFPNLNWNDIQDLFYNVLTDEIDGQLLPRLRAIMQKNINFQSLNIILNRQIPQETFQKEMLNIILKFIKRFEIRHNLENFMKVVENNLIEKYLDEIFEKKAYIAREIQFVEKLKLSPEFLSGLVKVIMLISLLGYIRNDISVAALLQKSSAKENRFGNIYAEKSFYEKLIRGSSSPSLIRPSRTLKKSMALWYASLI